MSNLRYRQHEMIVEYCIWEKSSDLPFAKRVRKDSGTNASACALRLGSSEAIAEFVGILFKKDSLNDAGCI
ncbi:hypothetical protein [Scytonema sp. PCC 10023]|uniref:hypothetical protein n=1 Tax=Scytonema sp. PCC 10023 TaxID=1680591 RepID=UPI0039C6E984